MTAFKLIELNYTNNLLKHYNNLAKLPGFVLLESADKSRGRYDILSAFPYDSLRIEPNDADPAKIFSLLQKLIPSENYGLDLPFQGGAIGYFSYDFAATLAGISSPTPKGLEGMPMVELGLYDWAIICDHHLKKIQLFAANTKSETALLIPEILQRWEQEEALESSFSLKKSFYPLISKEEYQSAFSEIYQDLQRGRAYQVNYTQPFKAEFSGDSWAIYKKIRAFNPVPYSAFLRNSALDILSFSPERFLLLNKKILLTSPIKGTAKRGKTSQEDELLLKELASSSKNRAENVMIVDLLRNDLGKISKTGSVHVRNLCAIESYQSVHHLVSHVEGHCLEKISSIEAFKSCFPGGSITGAPKLESMRIIGEQEAYARGVYCGSIGYFSSHGRFDTNIAIRTVLAREESLYLGAGGGIVIDSNCEEEYRECFTKIAAIVNGLL